jgi:hypothetical protein
MVQPQFGVVVNGAGPVHVCRAYEHSASRRP